MNIKNKIFRLDSPFWAWVSNRANYIICDWIIWHNFDQSDSVLLEACLSDLNNNYYQWRQIWELGQDQSIEFINFQYVVGTHTFK